MRIPNVFRVQMNTLEWLPIFLSSLWLFAIYHSDVIAAIIDLVWIAGRIVHMIGYTQSVPRRSPGVFVQVLATAVLPFGSIIAIVWRMMH
jgi:glutathione S-transferase